MDFSALIADLRTIASRYNSKDTDRNVSTSMYCEMFRKILQKAENGVSEYGDQIVILWMTLSQLCNTYQTLTSCPARDSLYQHIFLLCAKVVLNIKWQQLPEDDQGKVNFSQTIANTHQHLVNTGFKRFELLTPLMENPWTDPILSKIMSGDEKEESSGSDTETEETEREKERKVKERLDEIANYVRKEDSLILKLRVEMLILENCEDFALNLCNCIVKYEPFKDDLDLREMQFKLLHKLNHMDKLQEECEQIICHTGIKIINRLEQKESNQQLCVRLVQIFLVQDWINPDRNCCTKELLKLWIRHQYMADRDRAKFLENVWSIAKLSSKTEQIGVLVTGLQKECGTKLRQLYTDLCVYAINLDKGGCEQEMMHNNMDGVKEKQISMAATCEKLANIIAMNNLKAAKVSALTAFSLNPSRSNMYLVEKMYVNKTLNQASTKRQEKMNKGKDRRITHDGEVNLATLYEVERILNMFRPYYLNPDLSWSELFPVCQKFMLEKGTNSSKETQKSSKEKMSDSVKDGLMQYYCDDTTQFTPYKQAAKAPTGNSPPKSPWTSTATQSKPAFNRESKLIPYAKLKTMSIEGSPIDMTKSSPEAPIKPKGKPEKTIDFAKLLEATKNMPQMQALTKTATLVSKKPPPSTHGNFQIPYVPGLTTKEVERALVQHQKNLSRSFSVDQLKVQKSKVSSSDVHQKQAQRSRTLSLERQISEPGKMSAWSSATDLSKTSNHRPRIIPERSHDKALTSFQHSFGSNANQSSSTNKSSLHKSLPSKQLQTSKEVTNNPKGTSDKQSVTTATPARRSRQPSKEELQSIVDWLQIGTEDAKINSQLVLKPSKEESVGLVPKKKKESSTKTSSQDNSVQYVAFGSSPGQAIQNTKPGQQLKIKGDDSKNFASQVMTKVGIRPGMTEEQINIAKIKLIMRQQQEEALKEKQLKEQQKKQQQAVSKGFLLIPGSAHMVMQSKLQGHRTKLLQDKHKLKTVQPSSPSPVVTVTTTTVTTSNYQPQLQNIGSHDGYMFVNHMIQSTKQQSIKQTDLSTQPTLNLGAQPITSQVSTSVSSSDGHSKPPKYREVDIQNALQSLSKVLDKSSTFLNQNPTAFSKSNKSKEERPTRPASAMPSLMSTTTIVVTTQPRVPLVQSFTSSQTSTTVTSVQKQQNEQGQNSAYQLLYLGQIKTGKSSELNPVQQLSGASTLTVSNQMNSVPVENMNSVSLASQGMAVQSLPVQNLNNPSVVQNFGASNLSIQNICSPSIQTGSTENVMIQGLGGVSQQPMDVQTFSAANMNLQQMNVQGMAVQTMNHQNIAIPGMQAETMNTQNMVVQEILPQAVQTLQGSYTEGLAIQTVNTQNTLVQGFGAQTLGFQTISGQTDIQTLGGQTNIQTIGGHTNIQTISAPAFSVQGITNNNNIVQINQPVGIQGLTYQPSLDTNSLALMNQGQSFVGVSSMPQSSQTIGFTSLPDGGISMNIKRAVPNTSVTFTNSTRVMSAEVSAPTNILPLNSPNTSAMNNVILPGNSLTLTQTTGHAPMNYIGNMLQGGPIANTSIMGNVISTGPASFNLVHNTTLQPGQIILPNSSNNTTLSLNQSMAMVPDINTPVALRAPSITPSTLNLNQPIAIAPALQKTPPIAFGTPSFTATAISPRMPKQNVTILPKTATTTSNVVVGPFRFVPDPLVMNTVPTCSSSQGYLLPVTNTNSAPTILPSPESNVGSVTMSVAQPMDMNIQSPILEAMLNRGKGATVEDSNNKKAETTPVTPKKHNFEIVRRVSASELERETTSTTSSLSCMSSKSLSLVANSECKQTNVLNINSVPLDENLKLLENVDTTMSAQPGIESLITNTMTPISNTSGVNIVDVHITTFSNEKKENEAQDISSSGSVEKTSDNQNTLSSPKSKNSKTDKQDKSGTKLLSDNVHENFWKDFSRFKERLANCKRSVTPASKEGQNILENNDKNRETCETKDTESQNDSEDNLEDLTYRELIDNKITNILGSPEKSSEETSNEQDNQNVKPVCDLQENAPEAFNVEQVSNCHVEEENTALALEYSNTDIGQNNDYIHKSIEDNTEISQNVLSPLGTQNVEINTKIEDSNLESSTRMDDVGDQDYNSVEDENMKNGDNDSESYRNTNSEKDHDTDIQTNIIILEKDQECHDKSELNTNQISNADSDSEKQFGMNIDRIELSNANHTGSEKGEELDVVASNRRTEDFLTSVNGKTATAESVTAVVNNLKTTENVGISEEKHDSAYEEESTGMEGVQGHYKTNLKVTVDKDKTKKRLIQLVDYSETSDSDANFEKVSKPLNIVDYPESSDSDSEMENLRKTADNLKPSEIADTSVQNTDLPSEGSDLTSKQDIVDQDTEQTLKQIATLSDTTQETSEDKTKSQESVPGDQEEVSENAFSLSGKEESAQKIEETVSSSMSSDQVNIQDKEISKSFDLASKDGENVEIVHSSVEFTQAEPQLYNDCSSTTDLEKSEQSDIEINKNDSGVTTRTKNDSEIKTPTKNDLVTNYKKLMDEMLSLSSSKQRSDQLSQNNDKFSMNRSFGFDDLDKNESPSRQNGGQEKSVESFSIFADDLNKLPESCSQRDLTTRSLPDDWAPRWSKQLEQSFSKEGRTLKRSFSDVDLSKIDGNSSDFESQSVISDREYQEKSLQGFQTSDTRKKSMSESFQMYKLNFCGKSGKYRLALPQLQSNKVRPKSQTSLLTYNEWKNNDKTVEIVTQQIIESVAIKPEIPIGTVKERKLLQDKRNEPKCQICQRTFDTMKRLQQHVKHPCRMDLRKTLDCEYVFNCNICKASLKTEFAAKLHCEVCNGRNVDSGYSMNTFFRCKMCGEKFILQKSACDHVDKLCKKLPKHGHSPKHSESVNNSLTLSTEKQSSDINSEKSVTKQRKKSDEVNHSNAVKQDQQKNMEDEPDHLSIIPNIDPKVGVTQELAENEMLQATQKVLEIKSKRQKIEFEKDIDNESVKSFSTESSYVTIDASETSSIKSGDYKPKSVQQKHSARLINKKIGKRMIKAKKFFGDQFEVPEFVEKQAKKVNLKRKFKPGYRANLNISPKLRRALKNKKISKVRKTFEALKNKNNSQVKEQMNINSRLKNQNKVLKEEKGFIVTKSRTELTEKVTSYKRENFTMADSMELFRQLTFEKKGRKVFRCPIKICRGPYKTHFSMMAHFDKRHNFSMYKKTKSEDFQCTYCSFRGDSENKIVAHSANHLTEIVMDNISNSSLNVITVLLSIIDQKKKESISQSEDTVSLNNKTVSKVTQDLKDDLKPGQEISRNKTSIRTRKTRMIEENDKEKMRKEIKCDIKDITVSKKGKEDTIIGKNSKKTIYKLSKKEIKSDNNTAEQHSIHEPISIRQRSRRQSEKMTPVKELDIKTENDSLKSDEFDNNQDSLQSPDSSFVRRSSRKRTDGLSVYKDFQLSNKKAAKSVEEDDAVCRSEENQSQVIDDVKVLNKSLNTRSSKTLTAVKDNNSTSKEKKKDETKEKLNNKTSRPRTHNRNSNLKEAENCDVAEKSNDKKVITNCKNFDKTSVMNTRKSMEKKSPSKEEPESDCSRSHNTRRRHLSLESNSSKISVSTAENEKSETPSRRSTRIRHSSRESDSSKTSFTTTEDVKKEAIESLSTRSTRKRHSSTESNASKMSNQGKKIKSENATSADKKDDKKDQHTSKKKSNSDQQLLEANKNLMEPLPRKRFSMDNKADETDLLKSDRHLRDRKSVENSEEMKQKDSNSSKKKELSETYEGGKDTQNAFLDSFKQFVGISKPTSVSYPIKSLKQGKSSKLKSQANIHQRKQLRKVKEETNRVEQNAKGKMELGDLIEIKDFRKSNKNTSKDNKKVEVIDLTEDMESIDTKQQSMKEAGSSSNSKLNNSTSHKPSFLDSFLAHVNYDSKTFDGRNSSTKRKNDFSSNLDVKHMKTSSEKADSKISESHNHDNKELKGSNKQHAKSEKAPVEQTKSTKEQTRSKGPEKAKTTSKNQQKEASRTKNIESKRLTQNCNEKRNDKMSGVNDVETKQANVEQKSKNSGETRAVKEKNEKNRKGKGDSLKIEKKNKGTLCKSPGGESQFQNSFMSYIGSNSSSRRDRLSQKKSPFKWELDDEETDTSNHSQMKTYEKKSSLYIESKPSKQPKSGECSESKSSSPLDKSTENSTVDKSTENSTVDESTESSKSPNVDKSDESSKSSKVDKNTESSKSSTVAKSTESSKSSTVTKSTESSKSSTVAKSTESSKSSKVNKSTESSKSSTVTKSTESSKSPTVAKSTESSKSSKANKNTESSKSSTVAKSTESVKSSYKKSSENVKFKESMDTNADSDAQISDKSKCVNVCTNEKSEKQVQHKSDSLSKKQSSKSSRSSKSSKSKGNNKNNTKSTRKKSARPKSDKEYLDRKSKRTSPSSSNSSSDKSCAGKDSIEGEHTDIDFEKHFEKFVSTSLNTDIDLEESESQKSGKESVKLDKGKKWGVNKGQKHFTELSSVVSKTGEKKIVKMETKSVSSTLDRGVTSTTDSVKSRPAFRGFSSSAGHFFKNRIARYNLPSPPRKRYSSKAPFVVPKITTNKKLIPISEFSVVDSQEAKDKESSDSKSDTKSSSSTHHKLVPVDAHRIRHMYHGGKVWQIGQGSVSSTHLSSPTKRQQSNCQKNKALNIEEAKNTETMNVNDDDQKEVKSSEQGDEKDGEKHNRWKSQKRSAPTDDNVESKRTRSSPP
ncbi:Hypothetical predicted protein [Mytilus galloprovincialis]|uniref:C2H2-type domain-containing protein n=1 Tax=Mytilus galloprovincialis TaxID=29158 RepID=A0A8B6D9Z4_MYTGA|nr:Hypothetical predicted protein [Mytilus galloprovincialis]